MKRVRFAENQDDNNAEVPKPTSESGPSNLPAEAASSSSAATPSVSLALTASAVEMLVQVMSDGRVGTLDIGTKSGKSRIGHECVVTLHDANTNDDMTIFTDFHNV